MSIEDYIFYDARVSSVKVHENGGLDLALRLPRSHVEIEREDAIALAKHFGLFDGVVKALQHVLDRQYEKMDQADIDIAEDAIKELTNDQL